MRPVLLTALLLSLAAIGPDAKAEYLLLVDPTRLDAAVATRGPGLDGRTVRPRALAAVCVRDGVLGPAAFAPGQDQCRAVPAVAGLAEAIANLPVVGAEEGTTVAGHVAAGGIVAVETRRRLACAPGSCSRELFDDAGYPPELVGRPPPPPLPAPIIQQFSVAPDTVAVGESALLSWTAVDVNRCVLEDARSGATLAVGPIDSLPVEPTRDSVWTLTCAAPGGRDTAQAAVTVTRPPELPEILLFEALRADVPIGERAPLVWSARQADQCAIATGEATLPVPPSGRRAVPVDSDTRFVLFCANASGIVDADLTVRVTTAQAPPTITFFQLARSTIERGDSIIASWEAPGATECRLRENQQGGAWRLGPVAQFRLAPAIPTTYALSCRNAFGIARATRSVNVIDTGEPLQVPALVLTDLAGGAPRGGGPLALDRPGLVNVTWSSQSAASCRLSDDAGRQTPVPLTGSRILPIDQTTGLQLNCVSSDAEAQAIAQVRVRSELLFADGFE